jgi:hypothetical protein
MLNTPVLLLIFNRPDTTRQVFEAIRKVKPRQLFIAADGPRPDRPDDLEKCKQARAIIKLVDWDCEVKTLFREENLGCGVAPAGGIDWFFENVEAGIILEDDCLPDISFFSFCQNLLDFYRDNEQIMHISGNNFQYGVKRGSASYYFSNYPHSWGWATWRRAWIKFDFNLKNFAEFKEKGRIAEVFSKREEQEYWIKSIESVIIKHRNDVWDYQWMFAIWYNRGLAVLPNVNLVTNIGFGENATHTTLEDKNNLYIKSQSLTEITHPDVRAADNEADSYTFLNTYHKFASKKPSLLRKVIQKVKSYIKS